MWKDGRYQENPDVLYMEKTLFVRLSDFDKLDRLMSQLDIRGVDNIHVVERRHNREQEYRKELKIAALKAARDKAQYLVESVDAKLGPVLRIDENDRSYHSYRSSDSLSNIRIESPYNNEDSAEGADAEKITIRYTMDAVFEIE